LALGGIVVAGAAAAFGVVILRDEDRARPLRWRADFETGNLSQWQGRFTPVSLGTGTADITVVQSPVKQGNYALASGRERKSRPAGSGARRGQS
jgi:hypothetical protein